jgi:hypothetical protein
MHFLPAVFTKTKVEIASGSGGAGSRKELIQVRDYLFTLFGQVGQLKCRSLAESVKP